MATSAVNNTTGTTGGTAANGQTTRQIADRNFQDFLKLLTTQLQNQDPTDPTDTNQLTQQIATLSQVEQQIATNANLQKLVSLFNAAQTGTAVSYIGKIIDADGNSLSLHNGQALLAYDLPSNAADVTVSVLNNLGQTVYSAPGTKAAGRNDMAWDGRTDSGATAPNGVYSFVVAARDAAGNTIDAKTITTGVVNGVENKDGATQLSIGSLYVPLDKVKSIKGINLNIADNQ